MTTLRLTFCFFFLLCTAFLSANVEEIAPGVEYEFRKTKHPKAIHIIKADPKKITLVAAHALDDGLGREPLSSMAKRLGAIAAINAGFFKYNGTYDGLNVSTLKVNGQWLSMAKMTRGAMGWKKDFSHVLFDRLKLSTQLTIDGKELPVDEINRERSNGKTTLFNWAFHRSTLTPSDGTEIVIENDKVACVREQQGNSIIPYHGYVYSIDHKSKVDISSIKRASTCKISYEVFPTLSKKEEDKKLWNEMDYIVGGTPLLIKDGEVIKDIESEQTRKTFLKWYHPRTAIGTTADGKVILVVVDGRDPLLSVGMNINELTELMKELGCTNALNLDGGGSATMTIFSQVVNFPCNSHPEEELNERSQRPISDAILILPKQEKKP